LKDKENSSSKNLRDRINKAQVENAPKKARGLKEVTAYGKATRLVAELVSGLVLGVVIGLGLDKLFGTGPWMLIIFFILGTAAGILNVMRASKDLVQDLEKFSETYENNNIDDDLDEDR
jgi:ATP synthase protein I